MPVHCPTGSILRTFVLSDGIAPDPLKIKGIQAVPEPQNASELRSFLGMVNYCGRFIPDLATISSPLRELTKVDTLWEWNATHTNAFTLIKKRMTECCTMSYFNPNSKSILLVDASPVGLGAILTQQDSRNNTNVVALASRALTPVEQRYSQTEREALAITWAVIHFHLYVYGASFEVITDHKPLVTLFNSSNSKPPLRLERWILKLQAYDYTVLYEPGKSNPADYMSRHPQQLAQQPSFEQTLAEAHVNFIASHSVPKTVTSADIVEASKHDQAIQLCMNAIVSNTWNEILSTPDKFLKAELTSLHNVRDELTVSQNCEMLLLDPRIIIPQQLRHRP